jgi:hypothetical protein
MIPYKIVLLVPSMCKKDNKYSFMYSLDHFTSKIVLDRLIIIFDFFKKNLMLFRNLAKE